MDIHALIQKFLQQQSNLPPTVGGEGVTKAGVVPFVRDPYRFYLMKPVAKQQNLGAPKFQLCKGTRMMKVDGVWQDITPSLTLPPTGGGEIETLAQTALREGIEELGLILENIGRLFDMGAYDFSSATTGKGKTMWLFAAEMKSEEFSPEVAPTTADRGWLTLEEFNMVGREDHRYILEDIEKKLKEPRHPT
jgi:hypothetical protein